MSMVSYHDVPLEVPHCVNHRAPSFPDIYGKGYTQAPQTTYNTYLFVTQLALLMQYVKWENANIVGFSMVS